MVFNPNGQNYQWFGFQGINAVNRQLENISNVILPLTQNTDEQKSSILYQNKLNTDLLKVKSQAQLDKITRESAHTLTSYQEAFANNIGMLKTLTQSDAMPDELTQSDASAQAFFSNTQNLLDAQTSLLTSQLTVQEHYATIGKLDGQISNEFHAFSQLPAMVPYSAEIQDFYSSLNGILQLIGQNRLQFTEDEPLEDFISELNLLRKDLTPVLKAFEGYSQEDPESHVQYAKLMQLYAQIEERIWGAHGINQHLQNMTQQKITLAQAIVQSQSITQQSLDTFNGVLQLINRLKHQASTQAADALSSSKQMLSIIALLSLLVAIAISAWVVQTIRTPMKQSIALLRKVADGDLTQRLHYTQQDEFGKLARWLNTLTERLTDMIGNIVQGTQTLADEVASTQRSTQEAQQNIEHQQNATSQVTAAIEQMTATVHNVAHNAEQALQQVNQAQSTSDQGQQVVKATVHHITQLAQAIESIATVIGRLENFSHKIGSVLDVINGISEQTNLLALNAAIEAARAGEHGRGFSVVADEVRTLAIKTQASTTEIKAMIDSLQGEAKQAVNSIEGCRKAANVSVDNARLAGESLEAINRAVSTIQEMSFQIASAAEQQSQSAHVVSDNIQQINQLAEVTADNARQTTQSCDNLAALAQRQNELVAQFRLT